MDLKNSISYNQKVLSICGKEHLKEWLVLQPKIYYKDGNPYGLIGATIKNGVIYIASTAINIEDQYTIGMIKTIKNLYNIGEICLISGSPERHNVLKEAFKRYNFNFKYEGNVMYAFGKGGI